MNNFTEISKKIETIHLKTKILEMETLNGEIIIDIQSLLKLPVGSEDAYFKVTDIAKKFDKQPKIFVNQLPSVKEYIKILEQEIKGGIIPPLKKGRSFIYTKRGKYDGGTWVHKELFLKFASWVSIQFERDMHRLVMNLLIYSDQLKIDRLDTKFLYKELGKTVQDIYQPKQSTNKKRFTFINLANLINLKVLGFTAKDYRQIHNIDENKAVRDTLSDDILEQIIEVEKDMNGYIKYGEIYDYDGLKKKIFK